MDTKHQKGCASAPPGFRRSCIGPILRFASHLPDSTLHAIGCHATFGALFQQEHQAGVAAMAHWLALLQAEHRQEKVDTAEVLPASQAERVHAAAGGEHVQIMGYGGAAAAGSKHAAAAAHYPRHFDPLKLGGGEGSPAHTWSPSMGPQPHEYMHNISTAAADAPAATGDGDRKQTWGQWFFNWFPQLW